MVPPYEDAVGQFRLTVPVSARPRRWPGDVPAAECVTFRENDTLCGSMPRARAFASASPARPSRAAAGTDAALPPGRGREYREDIERIVAVGSCVVAAPDDDRAGGDRL
ncbi:hypothetical protein GCM10027073_55420 [Streptomyces chlorus]